MYKIIFKCTLHLETPALYAISNCRITKIIKELQNPAFTENDSSELAITTTHDELLKNFDNELPTW